MSELAGNAGLPEMRGWEAKIHTRVHDATRNVAQEITNVNGMAEYVADIEQLMPADRFGAINAVQGAIDAAYVSPIVNPQTAWEHEMIRMGLLTGYVCGQRMITALEREDFDQQIKTNFGHFKLRVASSPDTLKAELFSSGRERYEEQRLYVDSNFVGHAAFAQIIQFDGSYETFWNSFGYTLGMACTFLRMKGVERKNLMALQSVTDESVLQQHAIVRREIRELAHKLANPLLELTSEVIDPYIDGTT